MDQLTWLVEQSTGTATPAYLAQLQARIEQCDRAGGANARLPTAEDTSAFADIVALATGAGAGTAGVRALLVG